MPDLNQRMAELARLRDQFALEALFWWGYAKRERGDGTAKANIAYARGDMAAKRVMEMEKEMVKLADLKKKAMDQAEP